MTCRHGKSVESGSPTETTDAANAAEALEVIKAAKRSTASNSGGPTGFYAALGIAVDLAIWSLPAEVGSQIALITGAASIIILTIFRYSRIVPPSFWGTCAVEVGGCYLLVGVRLLVYSVPVLGPSLLITKRAT